MIITLAVSGYRSIRDIVLPLEQLTIITGSNGSGKSSLYKSIRLLSDVAQGRAIGALAREGGIESTLWAGPDRFSVAMKRRQVPVQGSSGGPPAALKLGFATLDYGYAIDLGLPIADSTSMFNTDPEIKAEALWVGERLSTRNELTSRRGSAVFAINDDGQRECTVEHLPNFESMMGYAADPKYSPELVVLRERLKNWRFYDQFRTDAESAIRRPQIGTRTLILSSDGVDLAAAFRTILEIGDHNGLAEAIEDAFPECSVHIKDTGRNFELQMHQPGLLRPLSAQELSDGTLRYLCLIVALLSPRPPELMVLNEPETSLHPSLLEPLARLIKKIAKSTQIIVVSHATSLVAELMSEEGSVGYELEKELGETRIKDLGPLDVPNWRWPKR